MTTTTDSLEVAEAVGALISGENLPWSGFQVTGTELLQFCIDEDLVGLVHQRIHRPAADWPAQVLTDFEQAARAEAAREMLRRRELTVVLDALAGIGVRPVLFKGTALAYLTYPSPELRPRNDTDLLLHRGQVEPVRDLLKERGYREPTYCDGELLFCQFEMQRSDEFEMLHALDFHWKISTQTLFADLLSYDELLAASVPIPALGLNALGAGPVHALVIACIHPVMHHRSFDRIIWLYDINLIASALGAAEWNRFVDLATRRGVAAICAAKLRSAADKFATVIPADVLAGLDAAGTTEATAAYLETDRRWGDELVANVRGLKSWRDRVRLLREVAFPSAAYMLKSYRLTDGLFGRAALPALYAHRGVAGIFKVLSGRK